MNEDPRSENSTYAAVRRYLRETLEHMTAAEHPGREFVSFVHDRFGAEIQPHLRRFLDEVREGRVRVKGLTKTVREAVLGAHVSSAQRERMIREAAYMHAERRGFTGGSADDDWLAAEREVDARLAEEAGLAGRSRRAIDSARSVAEQEIGQVREAVAAWLERRGSATGRSRRTPNTRDK